MCSNKERGKGVGLRLVYLTYLHEICNFPPAFAPLGPPDYLIVDEILAHYPWGDIKITGKY